MEEYPPLRISSLRTLLVEIMNISVVSSFPDCDRQRTRKFFQDNEDIFKRCLPLILWTRMFRSQNSERKKELQTGQRRTGSHERAGEVVRVDQRSGIKTKCRDKCTEIKRRVVDIHGRLFRFLRNPCHWERMWMAKTISRSLSEGASSAHVNMPWCLSCQGLCFGSKSRGGSWDAGGGVGSKRPWETLVGSWSKLSSRILMILNCGQLWKIWTWRQRLLGILEWRSTSNLLFFISNWKLYMHKYIFTSSTISTMLASN